MRCYVNGQEVPSHLLARVAMNFGQPFPGPANPIPFQMQLTTDELVQGMNECYEKMAVEDRADVPFQEPGEFPEIDRWQELAYPSLSELLVKEPALAGHLFRDWLGQELLDHFLPGIDDETPPFLINSIDRVTIDANRVHVEGQAYPHPMLVSTPQPPVSSAVFQEVRRVS